jgi:hypothetical protein
VNGTLPNGYHWTVEATWQAEKALGRAYDRLTGGSFEPTTRLERATEWMMCWAYRTRKAAERRHPRVR